MRHDDVDAAEQLSAATIAALEARTGSADWPAHPAMSAARSEQRRRFMHHLVEHDPAGCWVAEDAGLVGIATSLRREGVWGLSSFFVAPEAQSRGIGASLLEAALTYSRGCLRGMICASHDPRAARRYRLAGFTLHPSMVLRGSVDRSALPVVDRVRDGGLSDLDLCNSVDRQTRGAGHGVDHELLAAELRLVVVDQTTGSGYCYVGARGGPHLLAATNRRTAIRLLWESLAAAGAAEQLERWHVTAAQEWAVDVALAAGLQLHTRGYLALRNMKPPMPYLPSGFFL